MFAVDDPTLALIARFVGGSARPELSDTEFLHRQVAAIQQYVERFPEDERESRAFEWIEANARAYRQKSQKRAAVEVLGDARCPDCPLSGGDAITPCSIHTRWLALLRRYAASELSSHDYVEASLALLEAHKNRLKVGQCREPSRFAAAAVSCST
ncbi:MAG: hypothetical protein IPH26_15120 [Sterolibacteriaceae bacterium]|uniref:Uncharacterized protein n=1 Tax=Candidatus Methylophosphatis roskildensis TaxID=2899263 RepID=A0A9D7E5J9_9PROT|nr:hypothetical protein [Candidatus Methylophosphatis roskildensis]